MARRIPVGTVLGVRCFAELPCGAYLNDGFARWRFDGMDGDTVRLTRETCDDSVSYDVPGLLGGCVAFYSLGVPILLYAREFRQP